MNIIGKRWSRSLALWTTVTTLLVLLSAGPSVKSQNTGSLEAECVVVASADSSIVPALLTPQEYCKALVALVGNEWLKAAEQRAMKLVVDDLAVRLAAAEAEIAALQAQSPAAFQNQLDAIQGQLNGIDLKLSNAAAALQ